MRSVVDIDEAEARKEKAEDLSQIMTIGSESISQMMQLLNGSDVGQAMEAMLSVLGCITSACPFASALGPLIGDFAGAMKSARYN